MGAKPCGAERERSALQPRRKQGNPLSKWKRCIQSNGKPPSTAFPSPQRALPSPSSMLTSAKVKAQRPQSRGAQNPAQPPSCSVVPDSAGVTVMPPNIPQNAGSIHSSHTDKLPGGDSSAGLRAPAPDGEKSAGRAAQRAPLRKSSGPGSGEGTGQRSRAPRRTPAQPVRFGPGRAAAALRAQDWLSRRPLPRTAARRRLGHLELPKGTP